MKRKEEHDAPLDSFLKFANFRASWLTVGDIVGFICGVSDRYQMFFQLDVLKVALETVAGTVLLRRN